MLGMNLIGFEEKGKEIKDQQDEENKNMIQ